MRSSRPGRAFRTKRDSFTLWRAWLRVWMVREASRSGVRKIERLTMKLVIFRQRGSEHAVDDVGPSVAARQADVSGDDPSVESDISAQSHGVAIPEIPEPEIPDPVPLDEWMDGWPRNSDGRSGRIGAVSDDHRGASGSGSRYRCRDSRYGAVLRASGLRSTAGRLRNCFTLRNDHRDPSRRLRAGPLRSRG